MTVIGRSEMVYTCVTRAAHDLLTEDVDASCTSHVASKCLAHEDVPSAECHPGAPMQVQDDGSIPLLLIPGMRRGDAILVHEPEASGPDLCHARVDEGWALVSLAVYIAPAMALGVDGEDAAEGFEGRWMDPDPIRPLTGGLLGRPQRLFGVDDFASGPREIEQLEHSAQ